MRLLAVVLVGSSVVSGCGDDAADGLSAKRVAELSAAERVQLCDRFEPYIRQNFAATARVSCANLARAADDCSGERAACIAKIPSLDFDLCATTESRMRFAEIFQTQFADDPELADSVAFDPSQVSEPLSGLSAGCPLTVGQYESCLNALGNGVEGVAAKYSCESDEEDADFAVPEACRPLAEAASSCAP